MGSASLSPAGPQVAGSYASLTSTYTAGSFGIDDSGHIKIAWRGTSDMAKPQFTDPSGANYTTVEASNGAVLEHGVDRINTRPWVNTLWIRVGRGFLRKGETITISARRHAQGSPGLRLQTNVEPTFEFKVLVDAFATYEFTEVSEVAGNRAHPRPGEPVESAAAVAQYRWREIPPLRRRRGPLGQPDRQRHRAGRRCAPTRKSTGCRMRRFCRGRTARLCIENLSVGAPGDVAIAVSDADGRALCNATPMRVVAQSPYRHYWGDLHAQSEETIGTNSAEDYFAYARDKAFLDIVGHQGNDFQITDAFWTHLNDLTRQYDQPGRFVALPGYEWSGNTGMGGDRNIFYRTEGRPIRRSSRILVDDPSSEDCYTANDLFAALQRASRTPWSSPMSAAAMPTSAWRMTAASSAPWRSTRPGARSNGCCMTRSTSASASAWSATATTTRAGPAPRSRAPRRSARSAACPAI